MIVRSDIDCNISRTATVNQLRTRTSENQRGKRHGQHQDDCPVRCIYDQIGQDRCLPITENLAITSCSSKSSMCERASERVSERTNEVDKCLLSLHTRLRYLNECCNFVVVVVVVIYAESVEKDATPIAF